MKPLRQLFIIVSLFFLVAVVPSAALADADSERANLAKLVEELDALSISLSVYRRDAASNRRYRFNYDALNSDVRAMRKGIVEYIKRDLSLARDVPPLSAQYIESN